MGSSRRTPVVVLVEVVGALAIALSVGSCSTDDARTASMVGTLPRQSPAGAPSTDATATPTLVPAPTTTTPTSTATSTSTTTSTTTSTVTPTTVTPTTATSTTEPPAWPRRITMAFTGDILPHSPLWRQAERNAAADGREGFDFTPMLAVLRTVHDRVDLAVCHLETPIAPGGEELSTMPYYGVPAEIAEAVAAAGFDRCSTASNHTVDRGVRGIQRTVEVLEAAGIAQSGMARHPAEIEPAVFDVDGVAVSHLSYTWSYNGLSLPDGEEWRSALIDPERIVADARRARDLGAQVVIVSLHWGAEGVHAPTTYQRDVAALITAPGVIDLVVGHHAHVLQPIEQVNGTWVLFGLGNVLSNLPTSARWPAASQDAAIVTVAMVIDATSDGGGVTVERPVAEPTWVDHDAGWVVRLVDAELARTDLGAGQRGRLEASRARTVAVLGPYLGNG
jgi:hypothetical protein